MNVLITGSEGQLGSEIKDIVNNFKHLNFFFTNSQELNICEFGLLQDYIVKNQINAIINCAAYTNVDLAEKEIDLARKVNVDGVKNLVDAIKLVNGKLIHISTDYVFDGNHNHPYKEIDSVNPLGNYGKTKREGELVILNSKIGGIIIRSSWLYSVYGKNFFKTMLKLGKEKNELKVISDQIGTPTYAKDLAIACIKILSKINSGIDINSKIYHYSNEGVASWYDFANSIMELGKINCDVLPIETKDYPTLALRPHYSVLNKTKIKNDFNLEIPYWKDSLKKCFNKLNSI